MGPAIPLAGILQQALVLLLSLRLGIVQPQLLLVDGITTVGGELKVSCARAALDVWELGVRVGRRGLEAEDTASVGAEESAAFVWVAAVDPWRLRACVRRFGARGPLSIASVRERTRVSVAGRGNGGGGVVLLVRGDTRRRREDAGAGSRAGRGRLRRGGRRGRPRTGRELLS